MTTISIAPIDKDSSSPEFVSQIKKLLNGVDWTKLKDLTCDGEDKIVKNNDKEVIFKKINNITEEIIKNFGLRVQEVKSPVWKDKKSKALSKGVAHEIEKVVHFYNIQGIELLLNLKLNLHAEYTVDHSIKLTANFYWNIAHNYNIADESKTLLASAFKILGSELIPYDLCGDLKESVLDFAKRKTTVIERKLSEANSDFSKELQEEWAEIIEKLTP